MAKASVEVIGAREVRAALKRAEVLGTPAALRAASKAASNVVVQRALPNVPVRTGALKSTIRALGSQNNATVKAGTAKVDYAAAIHWGRKRGNVWGHKMGRNVIVGRPFLWDAAQASQAQVIAEYEKAMVALCDSIF